MIKRMFITIMVFSLFGCKTITLKEANYNLEVENEPEIKIKSYEIDKNKILLCIGNMTIKPYETYYLDFQNKVFGSSSLTQGRLLPIFR